MAQLKYIPAGIRLHLKEIYYKFMNNINEKYYISFSDIPQGLKAENILKSKNIDFKSIPVPDDIFEMCGVAILVQEYKTIIDILKQYDIEVEVFIYKDKKPIKIYGNIQKDSCSL